MLNELSTRISNFDNVESNSNGFSSLSQRQRNNEQHLEEFVKCIEIHKRIKVLSDGITKHFGSIILIQGFLSSLTLCVSAFTLSTVIFYFFTFLSYQNMTFLEGFSLKQENDSSGFSRVFSFMIPMTLLTFVPCYYGNELSIASRKVPQALFHSNWFMNDAKFRQIAIIFMENVKVDIKIRVFGLFDVNLDSFNRIINSSYSLFAVLRNLNSLQ
jgi:hypothetical protein